MSLKFRIDLCAVIFLMQYYVRRDFVTAASIVFSTIAYYFLFVSDQTTAITHLGIICNFFTICFFASPLSTMVSSKFRRLFSRHAIT